MVVMADEAVFVVALRTSLDPEVGVMVDCIMPAHEFDGDTQRSWTLRSRFNPEIRSIMLKAPAGTTPDAWVQAFTALTRTQKNKLYRKAVSL
jgi:hypothetical protein